MRNETTEFDAIARATQLAMHAATVCELVDVLWSALPTLEIRIAGSDSMKVAAKDAIQLAVKRLAISASPEHAMALVRRLLLLTHGQSDANASHQDAWLALLQRGAASLRTRYHHTLAEAALVGRGQGIVAIADMSGELLPVDARREGPHPDFSDRVLKAASELSQAVANACATSGVFCVGRLRMTRVDRPSRTLLECSVDAKLSGTGLPAIVVRAHDLRTGAAPEAASAPIAGCRVRLPAHVALRIAG